MTEENNNGSLENRSEIVLLYDARDTNPNGDPSSPNDQPRIDQHTNQCVVTDVRLKRYIRDELYERGNGIFVKSPVQLYDNITTKASPSRDALVEDLLDSDADPEEVFEQVKDRAIDVRYFGATFSLDEDVEGLPQNVTGPVQFGFGRSINPVTRNFESNSQTTVVASGEDKESGTFAEDNRIHYGLISFGGVVNENSAEDSGLDADDVELLDDIVWDALLNQTITRSKMGQKPRLYARVEYDEDNYHIGGLEEAFEMVSDGPLEEVRSPDDYVIDATSFVDALEMNEDKIDRIVAEVDWQMTFVVDGDEYSNEEFFGALPVDVETR